MNATTLERNTVALAVAFVLAAGALLVPTGHAHAATCVFTTNLEVGTESEAVRCLQQYLNATGFTVAATGVGSKGYETVQFKDKTKAAVLKWQTVNGIIPATGTFGPLSRAKYIVLTAGTAPAPAPTPTPIPTPTPVPSIPVPSAAETSARNAILGTHDDYDDAVEEYEDAKDDGDSTGKAKTYLAKAYDQLVHALFAFVDKDYSEAIDLADDASSSIDDALDEVDSSSSSGGDKADAKDAIADAKDAIDDAHDEIDDSGSSSAKIRKAEGLLDKAEDALADAKDAYGDGDYDDAVEYANDAEDYANDAIDAL